MVKRKDAASIAVRQAQMSVKDIRARSRKLLRRAELNVKDYRKQLSTLKKQGVVSKRINAARHQPTRYMVSKLKKFKGVAVGHELAVPLKKMSIHRARQYTEKGIAQRIGNFLIVPKTAAKQRADVVKGRIQITTQLKRGQEVVLKFGTRLEDMHDVLKWLETNEQMVNEWKGPNGQLGFQIVGHNSRVGLANVKELIKYLQKYDGSDPRLRGNFFNGDSHVIVKEFIIIKFRPAKGGPTQPTMEPYFGVKRYSRGRGKDRKDKRHYDEHRRENARKRKASQRMSEDSAAHSDRIAKQRQYDRARANERREKRMASKLMGD